MFLIVCEYPQSWGKEIQTATFYHILLKQFLILSLHLRLDYPSAAPSSGFLTKILYFSSLVRATRPAHFNTLDSIIIIIIRLTNPQARQCAADSVVPSLPVSHVNISLSTLF
jgi:hypothetical protein